MSAGPKFLLHKPVRLALVQLGSTSSVKAANLARAARLVRQAAQAGGGADLVLLPECFNSPYGVSHFPTYAESLPGLWDQIRARRQATPSSQWTVDSTPVSAESVAKTSESVRVLSSVAKEAGVVLVAGSIPERDDTTGRLYNTCLVFNEQGEVISMERKVHLFDIDIPGGITFKESETLTAGDKVTVFDCALGRFGVGICYDMRFPELAMIAARLGAAAMLYPGAFNTTTGPRHWELLQRARAVDNQIYVATCSPARPAEENSTDEEGNPLQGIKDGAYPSWGHSTVVDPWAQVVSTTDEKEGIVRATFDPKVLANVRRSIPITTQRRFDLYSNVAA